MVEVNIESYFFILLYRHFGSQLEAKIKLDYAHDEIPLP